MFEKERSQSIMDENKAILKQVLNYSLPPLYNKEFPLIIFFSPKSGCTSLIKWFLFQIGILEKAIKHNAGIHGYLFEVYFRQKNYTHEIMKQIIQSKKDVYKLVRNPYKRAVSSFLQTSRVGLLDNWKHTNLYRECEKISNFYYDNKNFNKGISFKQYLYYIKKVGSHIGTINPHIAQQYIEGEEFFVKKYIHLENFNEHISEIEGKYGLVKSPLSKITKSNHHFAPLMTITGDYSETIITKEAILRKSFPTYESFYDKETVDLIKTIFKKDFEVYGYKDIF